MCLYQRNCRNFLLYFQFCFAHDTARVIQCLIQFGTEEQRNIVFDELKGIAMRPAPDYMPHEELGIYKIDVTY